MIALQRKRGPVIAVGMRSQLILSLQIWLFFFSLSHVVFGPVHAVLPIVPLGCRIALPDQTVTSGKALLLHRMRGATENSGRPSASCSLESCSFQFALCTVVVTTRTSSAIGCSPVTFCAYFHFTSSLDLTDLQSVFSRLPSSSDLTQLCSVETCWPFSVLIHSSDAFLPPSQFSSNTLVFTCIKWSSATVSNAVLCRISCVQATHTHTHI